MFDMMTQAKNAIEAYNAALRVHNANIANLSVTGYKRSTISFQSILDSIMRGGTAASTFSNIGGTNPVQFGQGVGIANTNIDFTPGAFAQTTNNIDLAITGRGFFIVSDDGGTTYKYTRAGNFTKDFTKDSSNNLVTSTGMQVYGLNSAGSLTAITGLTGSIQDYSWNDGTGELTYQGTGTGTRIALTYFNNAGGLQQSTGTTFKETLSSGSPATPIAVGGAGGTVSHGFTEQSNVVFLTESLDTLDIQRAMSANVSAVRAVSDLISQFISKLG